MPYLLLFAVKCDQNWCESIYSFNFSFRMMTHNFYFRNINLFDFISSKILFHLRAFSVSVLFTALFFFCFTDAISSQISLRVLIIGFLKNTIFSFVHVFHFLWLFKNFLFIYFWLCWVFVAARGLSLVAVSGGYSSLRCVGLSLWWLLLLRSMGSKHAGFSSCGTRAQ